VPRRHCGKTRKREKCKTNRILNRAEGTTGNQPATKWLVTLAKGNRPEGTAEPILLHYNTARGRCKEAIVKSARQWQGHRAAMAGQPSVAPYHDSRLGGGTATLRLLAVKSPALF